MKNLSNQKFGKLTVVKLNSSGGKNQHNKWLCKCDCGNEKIVRSNSLTGGKTKSCGCLQIEHMIRVNKLALNTTHGQSHSRIYKIWKKMRQRCGNQNHPDYYLYGKNGVKVCKRWNKFENFQEDLLMKYNQHSKKYGEKNTTIDRINPFGDYKPSNI